MTKDYGRPSATCSHPSGHAADGVDGASRFDQAQLDPRKRLTCQEQMLDAQEGCVPCKLCGGDAVIYDAGIGAGYYIRCSGTKSFRSSEGCLIGDNRLGGWAYNVRDWWNRLHATRDTDGTATAAACEDMPVPKDCQAGAEGIATPTPEFPSS